MQKIIQSCLLLFEAAACKNNPSHKNPENISNMDTSKAVNYLCTDKKNFSANGLMAKERFVCAEKQKQSVLR